MRIDFAGYVAGLVEQLCRSLDAAERGVEVRLEVEPVEVPLERALPCGLIINELVTNCLRHAWPDGRRGSLIPLQGPAPEAGA